MVAMNEIADQEGYTKQYLPTAQKTLKDHGGVYVAAGPRYLAASSSGQ